MRIDIENMDAGYGDERILHGIDLHLEGPGLTCIIGPNAPSGSVQSCMLLLCGATV